MTAARQAPEKQIQILFKPPGNEAATERGSAALCALASLIDDDLSALESRYAENMSLVVHGPLNINASERLAELLSSNSGQLRLLGVDQVVLERRDGLIEQWVIEEGQIVRSAAVEPPEVEADGKPKVLADPVPRIWQFHLIYLVVCFALGLSAFRFSQNFSISMLLVAVVSALGLAMARSRQIMGAHVLAVAIGLGTPLVVCGRLWPNQTLLLFSTLVLGVFAARRILF